MVLTNGASIMVRFTPLSIIIILLAAASLRAQDADLFSELLPDHVYTFTVKKSHGGNDGFKDLIPHVSTQIVLLQTGSLNPEGLQVKLLVDRPVNDETKKNGLTAPVREWAFAFTITPAGALKDITTESSDGPLPESISRSVLATQLRALLFLPQFPLGPETASRPMIMARKQEPDGRVSITYEMPAIPSESSVDPLQATVTTAGGTAVFDQTFKFFTERRHVENAKMFMPADPTSGEQRVVTMLVTTNYFTTVDRVTVVR